MLLIIFLLCYACISLPIDCSVRAEDNCITSECHAQMGKAKYLHGPIAVNQCTVCHVVGKKDRPPKKHDLSLIREDASLCFSCHEGFEQFLDDKNLHDPVAEGECTVCHENHESSNKFLLTEDSLPVLCFYCHDDTMTKQKFVHSPVVDGDCIVCHNAHASVNDFLLENDRITLCCNCHDDLKAGFEKKFVHQPVKESCEKCHNPHGSMFIYQLKDDEETLCGDCHQEFVQKFDLSQSKHSAIAKNGCLGCHLPHFSDYAKGLRADKKDLCFSCHEDMKAKIQSSKYLHGPVKEGNCDACHDPHATNYPEHLRSFFPDKFYMPYKIDNYTLCFDCHNQEIATKEYTKTLTDFRNGDLNLHFLHVNGEKGRSCKACHEIHAGNQEKHIRTEVPYGKIKWMLPIKYTKTKTGGSCLVGCHKLKAYDRVKPMKYQD